MYIIVSSDRRIPGDLLDKAYEQWTVDEFFEHAASDEGLDIDEGLFYDVSVLTVEVYDALRSYSAEGDPGAINIKYYRFDDSPAPTFAMYDEVIVYSTISDEDEDEYEGEDTGDDEYVEPFEEQPVQSVIEEVIPDPPPVQPVQQPTPQPYVPPVQQPAPQPYVPPVQPVQQPAPQPYVPPQETYTPPQPEPVKRPRTKKPTVDIQQQQSNLSSITKRNLDNMLLHDDFDADIARRKKNKTPAKIFLFGSSKGGTGKTFTCLITAYWYAKMHPTKKIALADFDIIDGQIGITINKLTPTMLDFYKTYHEDKSSFTYLDNCKVKSDHFAPNLDFYLAPSQDIPKVTNDTKFWNDLFQTLIENYDVVFFDSGIDYLGKKPISQLYKIADKIIITCNPSINSTKSVIKQFKTLSGQRINPEFRPGDGIISRVSVVMTRVYANPEINALVENNLTKFAPVITKFGSIDEIISAIQWYQQWNLIDETAGLNEPLDKIVAELDKDNDETDE